MVPEEEWMQSRSNVNACVKSMFSPCENMHVVQYQNSVPSMEKQEEGRMIRITHDIPRPSTLPTMVSAMKED